MADGSDVELEQDLSRILTVPNLLSLCRLGLVAGFGVVLFADHERVFAAVLLAVAGVTDFLDGYIARHFGQVSTLGKVIDPTVDRLVLGTAIIAIVADGAVPIWLAALVLGREAFVVLVALVLASLGAARIDVVWLGKAGTFGLMVAFPLLLAGHQAGWSAARDVGWVVAFPSLALSLAAAVVYVPRARAALLAGRSHRGGIVQGHADPSSGRHDVAGASTEGAT